MKTYQEFIDNMEQNIVDVLDESLITDFLKRMKQVFFKKLSKQKTINFGKGGGDIPLIARGMLDSLDSMIFEYERTGDSKIHVQSLIDNIERRIHRKVNKNEEQYFANLFYEKGIVPFWSTNDKSKFIHNVSVEMQKQYNANKHKV